MTFTSVSLVARLLLSSGPLLLFLTSEFPVYILEDLTPADILFLLCVAGTLGKLEWEKCPSLIGIRLWQSLFPWTVGLCYGERVGHISQRLPSPLPSRVRRKFFLIFTEGEERCLEVGPCKTLVLGSFSFLCSSTLSLHQLIKITVKCSYLLVAPGASAVGGQISALIPWIVLYRYAHGGGWPRALVSSGCYKNYHGLGGLNNRDLFLIVLEVGKSKRKLLAEFPERPTSWLADIGRLVLFSPGKWERALVSFSSYKDTKHMMGALLS